MSEAHIALYALIGAAYCFFRVGCCLGDIINELQRRGRK